MARFNYNMIQNMDPNWQTSAGSVGRWNMSGLMGTPVGNEWARARQLMTSDPAYTTNYSWRPGMPNINFPEFADETVSETVQTPVEDTGYLRSLWEGTKDLASKFSPTGIINALTFRKGADQSFGGYPGGQFSRAGLFPQEVQNLQALADRGLLRSGAKDAFGTNVVSQFGDYNQHIADKKAQFKAKLEDTDYLSRFENPDEINTLEDLYNAYQTKYGPNSAIARRLNHYANFGGTGTGTVADKITDKITVTKPGDGAATTSDRGGGFNPRLDRPAHPSSRPSWHGATKERQAAGKSVAGPGFGQGAYWAEGGRVGLYQGGDPEEPDENIYEFMQDQGIPYGEMASAVDPMDALNDMSMNIFGKPLHQLTPEEYQMLIDMANDQAMAEQPEGLASLV